ncbi:MAG: thermonuclease family protein [Pseudomonadota bacterium]
MGLAHVFRRRRTDGFVWRTYIPTVVVQRRRARQEKLDAAVDVGRKKIKATDEKLRHAQRRARLASASGVKQAGNWLSEKLKGFSDGVVSGLARAAFAAGRGTRSIAKGAIKSSGRLREVRWSAFRLPRLRSMQSVRMPQLLRARATPRIRRAARPRKRLPGVPIVPHLRDWPPALLAGCVGVLAIGASTGGLLATGAGWASVTSPVAALFGGSVSEPRTIVGRARASAGDRLAIDDRTYQLAGITAPLPAQTCRTTRGRLFRCGREARQALARLVRRNTVTCLVNDATEQARCSTARGDLGGAMVARGLAFREGEAGARYEVEETAAKRARRGIWRGQPEHPEAWKKRVWDAARARAPNGCPIKGRVRRGAKTFLMPSDRGYRRARVRARRGDRWICSEGEAIADGWRAASAR